MLNDREWLEADGLGGFASGSASGIPFRRYHGLLVTSRRPPTERFLLVNGVEAYATTPSGTFALSSFRYDPGVIHPDGHQRISSFRHEPWPTWTFELPGGEKVIHEIFSVNGQPTTCVSWRLAKPTEQCSLVVRPLISGRDYHSLHVANHAFSFLPEIDGELVMWQPYKAVPRISALSNGAYTHEPTWYRNFEYLEELHRGFPCKEDLASPGYFKFDLSASEACLVLTGNGTERCEQLGRGAKEILESLRRSELARRKVFPSPLHRAADAYLVARGSGKTIVAGYPWFTDWGRDSFISVRGLCLATGRTEDAKQILLEWSSHISRGMLPNRFPDKGEEPEYNSVDAALWFVIAAGELLERAAKGGASLSDGHRSTLVEAIAAILDGYQKGTRFGIHCDAETGMIAAGERGSNLTWMDARISGGDPVTPRVGKPVEIQALWINALEIGGRFDKRWLAIAEKARGIFPDLFWNDGTRCLFDVVDVNHEKGRNDPSVRPNQVFACGGLPIALLDASRTKSILDVVEKQLVTPLGLRTLSPLEPHYFPTYVGDSAVRDMSYHQGTAWPWLMGPFVEAWVRARNGSKEAKAEARKRFLDPLLAHLSEAGLGHISEIADASDPHTPRGCPFQAWSVGEALRLDLEVLA